MKLWAQLVKANEPAEFLAAVAITFVLWIALALVRRYGARALTHFARQSATRWGDVLADTVRATNLVLLLPVTLYAGASVLDMPARLDRLVELAAVVALMLQFGLWVHFFIGHWAARRLEYARQSEPEGATALGLLAFAARIVVWALVILLVLEQLNIHVTTLVAGLGIGGIAVALAVQNVLGDLFASLSIVLDKPFMVGDFIVVEGLRGRVERVGIKTTRIRSLDGELLVFSNGDLLKSRIRNFQRMQERRAEFSIGVTYQTSAQQLRQIPQWLREAVEAQTQTRFGRAHFKEYGDSALVFEIVYFVLDADYNVYMNVQQAINLAIFERLEREKIEFAYPTRTLFLKSEAAPPAARS